MFSHYVANAAESKRTLRVVNFVCFSST